MEESMVPNPSIVIDVDLAIDSNRAGWGGPNKRVLRRQRVTGLWNQRWLVLVPLVCRWVTIVCCSDPVQPAYCFDRYRPTTDRFSRITAAMLVSCDVTVPSWITSGSLHCVKFAFSVQLTYVVKV